MKHEIQSPADQPPSAPQNPVEAEPDPMADPSVCPEAQMEKSFPIVGMGASAGGLAAFEILFSSMPADIDPCMAFVLVQHLAPDHKSILPTRSAYAH